MAKLQLQIVCLLSLYSSMWGIVQAQDINRVIDAGLDYLRKQQQIEGYWDGHNQPEGMAALVLLTLLKSDVPLEDPVVQKGFSYLRRHPPQTTYSISLLLMALEAAYISKSGAVLKAPTPIREWMQKNANLLLNSWNKDYWNYRPGDVREGGDLSNTQFAILGLKSASRLGLKCPKQFWYQIAVLLLSRQEKIGPKVEVIGGTDGGSKGYSYQIQGSYRARGWGYSATDDAYGSMTAAGVCSLLIARSELEGTTLLSSKLRQAMEQAIGDGIAWLSFHFRVDKNPPRGGWLYYYLYSLERVGRLSGFDRIGTHNWYQDGAEYILKGQKKDGSWGGIADTCFALLFLTRSTTPLPRGFVETEGPLKKK